jgi:hypothetical protein
VNPLRLFGFSLTLILTSTAVAQAPLSTPGFHHIHLNSTNPEGAIAFYAHQFPSATRVTFAGLPALKTGDLYLLFDKVQAPPAAEPQTAFWHFGWQVMDIRQRLALFRQRPEVHIVPLYIAGEGGAIVETEMAETKPGSQPPDGFAFIAGPDGGVIEIQGNLPVERINHLHLFQHDPFCAELWYHQHLNAPSKSQYTEATCAMPRPTEPSWPAFDRRGMLRQPAGVTFDDVAVTWHVQQNETPLAPTRGHLIDHFALTVANLDAWTAKLHREGVKFLTKPYKLGTLRAVMIEGPGLEAIELVESPKSDHRL